MKVVLFCGGLGMRIRDGSRDLPKPMVPVGDRPLLWHVMRYYAHFGHTEFILCLGHGAKEISDYFLHYEETDTNDFVLSGGEVTTLSSEIDGWRITFAHTGIETPIGERLRRVRHYLEDDEMFLANYADVLTDAPLDEHVERFRRTDALASLLAVPPQSSFHIVATDDDDRVTGIDSVASLALRENGGYFILRRELLDELEPGCDLVGDTLTRLAPRGQVLAQKYDGFWVPADTVKERVALDELARGRAHPPWAVWVGEDEDLASPTAAELTAAAKPR